MKRESMLLLAIPAALGANALANVTSTDEFVGEIYETFESVASPGGYPGTMTLFGGAGTLTDLLSNTVVIAQNWTGPSGVVLPFNGNLMGGTPTSPAAFEFTTPVTHFGGYINTVAPTGGGTATFWDADGNELASLSFSTTPIEWSWVGWESDVGIARIELMGSSGQGWGFQYDDLAIRLVPAPGTGVLAAMGLLAAGRRRRG
ncbi:MAG: hypothetical protein LAT64_05720 [Phycisphaerales bacterium]|nr:hypothetical protein [Planctomycetota bacterium]MCH8508254.1 hypothetical protein [Phycisphaerales bacterium]